MLFTPAFLFLIDVAFPTTPSTQLLFAVAFVPLLGPIIVGYRAVNSCSLVLGRASFCVAKRGTPEHLKRQKIGINSKKTKTPKIRIMSLKIGCALQK